MTSPSNHTAVASKQAPKRFPGSRALVSHPALSLPATRDTVGFPIGYRWAGVAYFFERRTGACFGPQLSFGYYSEGGEFASAGITYEYQERGWDGRLGVGVRLPVGESALITIGANLYEQRYALEIYPGQIVSDYDGSRRGFETSVGFSMWVLP